METQQEQQMRTGGKALTICLAAFLTLAVASWARAAGGNIEGTAFLIMEGGEVAYGYRLRIFLITEPLELDVPGDLDSLAEMERIDKIVSTHIDFFKRFREKADATGFIAADTESTPEGVFHFEDIAPGRYFVLVTFPSTINGIKVAWQEPVQVAAGQTTRVELTNTNLFLPTYTRPGQDKLP
jgi:hypothetical protein